VAICDYERVPNFELTKPLVNEVSNHSFKNSDYEAAKKDSLSLNNKVLPPCDFDHLDKENDATDVIHHFPILMLDNEPWLEATKFLTFKKNEDDIDNTTILSYANAIRRFINYCDKADIEFLISKNKFRSPLFRYRRYIEVENQRQGSYVKEELSKLVKFYKYLCSDCGVNFDYPPWGSDKKNSVLVSFNDGYSIRKEVSTTDVQSNIKRDNRSNPNTIQFSGDVIDDGERLRPLEDDETKILFSALNSLGNIEMTLAHQIMLWTACRTETVYTLRQIHFERILEDDEDEIIIIAGRSNKNRTENQVTSLINTKGKRRFVLKMDRALYIKIQIYIKSERAQKRYLKCFEKHPFNIPSHMYVFATQQGSPYFIGDNDPFSVFYQTPPSGSSHRNFVKNRLKPKMKELGFWNPEKRYKTHNIRATAGMLFLRTGLLEIEADMKSNLNLKKAEFINQLLKRTMSFMNHKNISITLSYLSSLESMPIIKKANEEYAIILKKLAGL
jgi:hypothetical protein